MILCLIGTAGLFALLGSYFMAALQVLVYAGAIMVLFIFIIMLINAPAETKRKRDIPSLVAAAIAFLMLTVGFVLMSMSPELNQPMPALEDAETLAAEGAIPFDGSAKSYGFGLYGKYMLPIQVMGFLLLAAMVGVIHLSKDLHARSQSMLKVKENTSE